MAAYLLFVMALVFCVSGSYSVLPATAYPTARYNSFDNNRNALVHARHYLKSKIRDSTKPTRYVDYDNKNDTPFCGFTLFNHVNDGNPSKFHRARWNVTDLHWSLDLYTPNRTMRDHIRRQLIMAFNVWAASTRFTFLELTPFDSSSDIRVEFRTGEHGDHFPFDGPGRVLAHAFYPYESSGVSGDIHFDAEEDWTSEGGEMQLFFTAVHEIGHSLGLPHSMYTDSVMYPDYKEDTVNANHPILPQSDVDSINVLYGRRLETSSEMSPTYPGNDMVTQRPTTQYTVRRQHVTGTTRHNMFGVNDITSTRPPVTVETKENVDRDQTSDISYAFSICRDICSCLQLNNYTVADVFTLHGDVFVAINMFYWRMTFANYYGPFQWPGLLDVTADAIVENKSRLLLYIFVDRYVYVYNHYEYVERKSLRQFGIHETTDRVNCAFNNNGNIYVLMKSYYYVINEQTENAHMKHIPLDRTWLPDEGWDAAVSLNGYVYLLTGNSYYKMNTPHMAVMLEYKRVDSDMFGCRYSSGGITVTTDGHQQCGNNIRANNTNDGTSLEYDMYVVAICSLLVIMTFRYFS